MTGLRNAIWISLGLWLLLAVVAHAQTPEPEDPAIVALGRNVTAEDVTRGHMIDSVKGLLQAYQAQKKEIAELKAKLSAKPSDGMGPTKQ